MTCVALIQARMTSSRLPGKVLADLAGRPLLEQMLRRISASRRLDAIVIATTENATDDPVAKLGRDMGMRVYRGDEHDVLGRMRNAAAAASADTVVRLTADCPMSDPAVIDAAIDLFDREQADYVSNVTRRSFPDGLDVEVMTMRALQEAADVCRHPFLREHVTPYVRGSRPDLQAGEFRRVELISNWDFGHIRFTVDTPNDLANLREVFSQLPDGFSWLDAISLVSRNPQTMQVTIPPNTLPGLEFRPLTVADAGILFRWRNAADVRAANHSGNGIVGWEGHAAWLRARLADPATAMTVAVYDGIPAGVGRLQCEENIPYVSITVAPEFRRRRVGEALITELRKLRLELGWNPLCARIRVDNPGSQAFFHSLGFRQLSVQPDHLLLKDETV